MGNDLMTANAMPIRNMDDLARIADMFAKSGYFTDAREAAQIGVKILAGREMSFGPFASVNGVHVIQGKPAVGANLMAAAVKSHPKYDYRVVTMTDEKVELEFMQEGKPAGVSKFDLQDAKAADVKNLQKFPRNMLFARALSNGVRWFCPDVFMGSSVYTPEELGSDQPAGAAETPVEDVETLDVTYTTSEPTAEPLEAVVTLPAATAEPTERIGEERAQKLANILADKHQVDNPLPFAQLFLNRDLTSLAELTEAEGVELLKAATEVQP